MIVNWADEIATPHSMLINCCMETSDFPREEKITKITSIYKSVERSSMEKCIPISALPVLSQVIERIVIQQLCDTWEKSKLLARRQCFFRKGSSTQHAVTLFSDAIRTNMDKGLMTLAVFIDSCKAFDSLDHASLLSKLSIYDIKDPELPWFNGCKRSVREFKVKLH